MSNALDASLLCSTHPPEPAAAPANCPQIDGHERDLTLRAIHDRQAFAHLYHLHVQPIANYLMRRTGDAHVTEDLVAEVFLSAIRGLPRWSHANHEIPVRFWLLRIATNAVNRWIKREARQRRRRDQDRQQPRCEPSHAARDLELTHALRTLPVDWQAALVLHHVEGLDVAQVALALGCRIGTVKSRLFRARRALREELDRRATRANLASFARD